MLLYAYVTSISIGYCIHKSAIRASVLHAAVVYILVQYVPCVLHLAVVSTRLRLELTTAACNT